jgi:hypothetical protein
LSPVRGCGKSTLLGLIEALAFKARRYDHLTSAVLFRLINRERPTLLLDEADNQDLMTNSTLRSVLNSGHRHDGQFARVVHGEVANFSTFAPIALAAIGKLPLPLTHRSICINMERAAADAGLERFDPTMRPEQARVFRAVYEAAFAWAVKVKLNVDPAMPKELRNRAADNWRPLFAIADAQNKAWGRKAREAAVTLSAGQSEDLGVSLLLDIRDAFDKPVPPLDRINSVALVAALIAISEGTWAEFRGPKENQQPHALTPASLAAMLAPFRIYPRTIWPKGKLRSPGTSTKGYVREQFERAWAAYTNGEESVTPSQPNEFKMLRRHS